MVPVEADLFTESGPADDKGTNQPKRFPRPKIVGIVFPATNGGEMIYPVSQYLQGDDLVCPG